MNTLKRTMKAAVAEVDATTIEGLTAALQRHPAHLSGEEDLTTPGGVVTAAMYVLDRLADDRPEMPVTTAPSGLRQAQGQAAKVEQDWLTDERALLLCEAFEVDLVEAEEEEIRGEWNWRGPCRTVSDTSSPTKEEAAKNACRELGLDQRRVTAEFVPQAWQQDYAVEVDPEGPTDYDVTDSILRLGREDGLKLRNDKYETDFLATAPGAPAWIHEWKGPFAIRVSESVEAFFEVEPKAFLEDMAMAHYREVLGTVREVDVLHGYVGDEPAEFAADNRRLIEVRILETPETDLKRWSFDRHLDPLWNVQVIGLHPGLPQNLGSTWIEAPSYDLENHPKG